MKYDSSLTLKRVKSYEIIQSSDTDNIYDNIEKLLLSKFSKVDYYQDNVDGGNEKGYVVDFSNLLIKSFIVVSISHEDDVYMLRISSYCKPQLYVDVILVFAVLGIFWSLSKLTVVDPNPIFYVVLAISVIVSLLLLLFRGRDKKISLAEKILTKEIDSLYQK